MSPGMPLASAKPPLWEVAFTDHPWTNSFNPNAKLSTRACGNPKSWVMVQRYIHVCAGRDLDLKEFYKAVQAYGGFASCVANKDFAQVTTELGIDKRVMTNASWILR